MQGSPIAEAAHSSAVQSIAMQWTSLPPSPMKPYRHGDVPAGAALLAPKMNWASVPASPRGQAAPDAAGDEWIQRWASVVPSPVRTWASVTPSPLRTVQPKETIECLERAISANAPDLLQLVPDLELGVEATILSSMIAAQEDNESLLSDGDSDDLDHEEDEYMVSECEYCEPVHAGSVPADGSNGDPDDDDVCGSNGDADDEDGRGSNGDADDEDGCEDDCDGDAGLDADDDDGCVMVTVMRTMSAATVVQRTKQKERAGRCQMERNQMDSARVGGL